MAKSSNNAIEGILENSRWKKCQQKNESLWQKYDTVKFSTYIKLERRVGEALLLTFNAA